MFDVYPPESRYKTLLRRSHMMTNKVDNTVNGCFLFNKGVSNKP